MRRNRRRRMRRARNDEAVVVVFDDEESDDPVVVVADERSGPVQPAGEPHNTTAAMGADISRPASPTATADPAGGTAADPEAGITCTICLEIFFEQGSHRPAALKCGHIFGNDCIRTWLQHKARCPQCNQKAKAKDITLLYNLPKAVAAGTTAADLEAKLQAAEASRQRERERAARLEAQLQEMQRQLAAKQQQQQHVAGPVPAAMPWQQQYVQYGACPPNQAPYQQHHQQQALQQQQYNKAGVAGSGPGRPWGTAQQHWQVQGPPAAVGLKRTWEQAVGAVTAQPHQPMMQHQQPSLQQLQHQQQTSVAAAGAADGTSSTLAAVDGPMLSLLPVLPHGAAADANYAGQMQQRCRMNGAFVELQQYNLESSRCFHLDVPHALLLVGERPNPSCSRLRKVSLVCPANPSYVTLPSSAGVIRSLATQRDTGLASNSGSNLLAVATEKAGLKLVNMANNNIALTIPVQSAIWSVAWSPQYEHQVLMGVDRGRLAVADLRKPSGEMLLSFSSGGSSSRPFQPLHSLIALHDWQLDQLYAARQGSSSSSSSSSDKWVGAKPEAIVACTGGVYSWGRSQPDTLNLLLPSAWHGGTCESIALASDGSTLAASFRAPLGYSTAADFNGMNRGAPVHLLAKLGIASSGAASEASQAEGSGAVPMQASMPSQGPTAAAAGSASIEASIQAGREQLLQKTLRLSGHSSSTTMTHGAFITQLPGLQDEQLLFASADEQSCRPRLWGRSSGAELLPTRPWLQMPTPVLQVAGGVSSNFGALLGAMSERRLVLYSWEPYAAAVGV